MNILVTGGCGFIGQHLVERLCSDLHVNSVWVLDSLEEVATGKMRVAEIAKLIPGDVCSSTDVNTTIVTAEAHSQSIDLVMHLAAQSHVDASLSDASSTMEVNAVGTQVVASACSYHNIPLLYCSTDEVYGPAKVSIDGKAQEMFEEDVLKPSSPYSAGKAAGELAVRAEGRSFGLRFAITRGCNAFGAYQYPEKLIPKMIYNIINNKPLPLYGNGKNSREWIYVKDHCEALIKIFKSGIVGETYNIGSNKNLNNIEICKNLLNIAKKNIRIGKKVRIKFIKDRPGHDKRYALNSSKLIKKLKWKPKTNFLDGINKTFLWYLNNKKYFRSLNKKDINERLGKIE